MRNVVFCVAFCVAVVVAAAPGGAVPPGAGGKPKAGQGITVSGSRVDCSPASTTDAGCVTAGAQQFAGVKSFQSVILDGGGAFPLKVRDSVCFANSSTGIGDVTTCTGHAMSASGSSLSARLLAGQEYLFNSGDIFVPRVVYSSGASSGAAFAALSGGYIDLLGAATGSLPTCNAGNAGVLQYDTTTATYKWCNGVAWKAFGTVSVASAAWSSVCFSTPCSGENVNFTGPVTNVSGTVSDVICSWNVAGTGTGDVVVKIRELTGPGTECTCALGLCTTAANTPLECACAATLVDGKQYVFQLDSTTNCSIANPGQIVCSATAITQN